MAAVRRTSPARAVSIAYNKRQRGSGGSCAYSLSWGRREQLYVHLNPPRFAFVLTRTRLKKTLRVCPQAPE
jgi:hypothetical protein